MESLLNLSRGDLIPGIGRRLSVARELQKEIEQLRSKLALEPGAVTEEKSLQVEGHKIVARRADGLSGPEMRLLADSIKKRIGTGVVILGKAEEGKATLLVAVTPDLAGKLRAGELAKALGPLVGGRGGGKAELAEAGGKDPSGVEAALEAGLDRVSSLLQSMRGGSTPAAGGNPV
jgi:alanyl-tRNA synthetase